jgi:hypothetical protein
MEGNYFEADSGQYAQSYLLTAAPVSEIMDGSLYMNCCHVIAALLFLETKLFDSMD